MKDLSEYEELSAIIGFSIQNNPLFLPPNFFEEITDEKRIYLEALNVLVNYGEHVYMPSKKARKSVPVHEQKSSEVQLPKISSNRRVRSEQKMSSTVKLRDSVDVIQIELDLENELNETNSRLIEMKDTVQNYRNTCNIIEREIKKIDKSISIEKSVKGYNNKI